ncbi:MAG TPA: DEAD/DEAH box helicase family protein [Anaerolineaceae bacterium]|nr:DEAD/DEAH box helicase family protein [Anaerolineaceae bacterium]HPL70375.1 DEAD/DEAH box helicase family protein [Brevefilum sp.]
MNEAIARIKINRMLEKAGWRFFDTPEGSANIILEGKTSLKKADIDNLGRNFEKLKAGYVDFLLLDEDGFPFIVLEAKREEKSPLDGKEQARKYARSQNVRFIILSNGNLHYFWDLERGNPEVITEFPRLESVKHRTRFKPNPKALAREPVTEDYIAQSQLPGFTNDPRWLNPDQRPQFITDQGLRILRKYQLAAVHALQRSAGEGNDRFLFEMATGTGKTLVAAAVIKLFLRTGNARRILFLVDRLELENQAYKNFDQLLKKDYQTVIYKENRQDWRKAEIVVTTVQSLEFDNKYMRLFSPTDFDLIISDEAHRSINGNSRAVFEYFVGLKLGLTATPKDYIKNIDPATLSQRDPRAWERRQLLDTYKTFGCEQGEPTYRYSLVDGVRDGYLVNPVVVDARTEITTQLLSNQGYAVTVINEEGEEQELVFFQRQFERTFFSDLTNLELCQTFLANALRDPLSGEIGKSIIFCVSQEHASRVTQLLNELAHKYFPDKYNSDFAVQITSNIPGAQEYSISFANNNLNGHTRFLDGYKSSKTRACVTVGMMTTGYDCQDILNLAMMRPIFSPTDFIQIKGRGTRRWDFTYPYKDGHRVEEIVKHKAHFKLFDFFANCEYFEDKFNYDEVIKLPRVSARVSDNGEATYTEPEGAEVFVPDPLKSLEEKAIGLDGMKIDRKLFERFSRPILDDPELVQAVVDRQWEHAVHLLRENYADKPEDYVTIEKLIRSEGLDRRLTWKEVLMRIFGLIDRFKTRDELLDEEFQKFVAIHKPEPENIVRIRNYMHAYLTDAEVRRIIDAGNYAELASNPKLSLNDLLALDQWLRLVPAYIKEYISINTYLP